MKVSVCIPTYNRPDQIEQILTNLLLQTSQPDEVVIVDASSDDRPRQVVMGFWHSLCGLVYEHSEKGLTRQRNRAIDLATGDVMVFLDDDIVLESDFIFNVRRLFSADVVKKVGGVTGLLLNEKSKIPGLGWRLKHLMGILETDKPGRLLDCGETTPLPRANPDQLLEVDFLPGGFTAWRKEVFDDFRYSLFFQGYGLGEDKYFSGSAAKKYHLHVSGDLRGYHQHAGGNRPDYFRWGYYNVYNHCFIMCECCSGRLKWLKFFAFHLVDIINDLVSWPLRPNPKRTLLYGIGRSWGFMKCLIAPPLMPENDPAEINRVQTRSKCHG